MTTTTRSALHQEGPTNLADPLAAAEQQAKDSPPSSPIQQTPEASEKPVRRQLKKTHIDEDEEGSKEEQLKADTSSDSGTVEHDDDKISEPTGSVLRGRIRKKRSFDEVERDSVDETIKHSRKRSKSADAVKESAPNIEEVVENEQIDPAKEPKDATDAIVDEPPVKEPSANLTTASSSSPSPAIKLEPRMKIDENLPPTSPKNKRSREPLDDDDNEQPKKLNGKLNASSIARSEMKPDVEAFIPPKEPEKMTTDETVAKKDVNVKETNFEEPEKKAINEEGFTDATTSKIPPTSDFENTSTALPSGSLPPTSPQQHTSAKAFASSGFASFATSASAFGSALAASKIPEGSNDGSNKSKSAPTVNGFASSTSTISPFASATTGFGSSSGFGAATSGFGSLSGGFGSAFKTGSSAPLTSFASSSAPGIIGLSSKPLKPFGAPVDDDDPDEGEASEPEAIAIKPVEDNAPKDPRFFEQEVETGEEGEDTVFTQRAKLYVITDKVWKERGVGVFKVNVAYDFVEGEEGGVTKKTARFIMRADGSHRIVLNSPITKDITITDPSGGKPKGKHAVFLGFLDGAPKLMQLKMKSNIQTEELHSVITGLLADLS